MVTLKDGTFSPQLTVFNVEVTDVDFENDTVSGIAPSGVGINVYAQDTVPDGLDSSRYVVSDGSWSADFSLPGGDPVEDVVVDLVHGFSGYLIAPDGFGNTIEVIWEASTYLYEPMIRAVKGVLRPANFVAFDNWAPSTNLHYHFRS